MFKQTMTESLESRLLMSASASLALNATVRVDRLQVQADLLQFRSDCFSCGATMLRDVTAIRHDDPRQATTVMPLVKKMRADLGQMRHALLAERLAEAGNVLADESVIVKDQIKALADRGNPTAEAADRAAILAERVQMQNDMIAGLNARIATRQAAYATLFADGQAIVAAVQSDPNAGAQLQADVQKWVNDRTTCLNTMTADLQKVLADRTQLVTDLTAMQPQA